MDHTKILANRADNISGKAPHEGCANCEEELFFAMQDNEHNFSLGLRTVLHCLKLAESNGNIPPLPSKWWISVNNRHGLKSPALDEQDE